MKNIISVNYSTSTACLPTIKMRRLKKENLIKRNDHQPSFHHDSDFHAHAQNIIISLPSGPIAADVTRRLVCEDGLSVEALHVVGGKHAGLPRPLHGAEHPPLVDGLSVDDHVTVTEGHLVVILSRVIVQRSIHPLQEQTCSYRNI